MANEFRKAAELKKRKAEARKARALIEKLEEIPVKYGEKMTDEDLNEVRTAVEALQQVVDGEDTEAIITAAEGAQKIYDKLNGKMNTEQEPASESVETEEAAEPAPEEAPAPQEDENSVDNAPVQEEPAAEEVKPDIPVTEAAPEVTIKPSAEAPAINGVEVSVVLHKLYKESKKSRLGGETKARFSALIKPSLKEKMTRDQENGDIRSANDLINALLEMYYGDE